MTHLLRAGLVAFAVVVWPLAAVADEHSSLPWKRISLSVGTFITESDAEFRLDGSAGRGTGLKLDRDLNVDEQVTTYRFDGFWRFFPRHRLDFSIYDLSRDGTRTLSKTISFGDRTFTIGAQVNSEFDLTVYKLGYSYSFVQNETFDIGASLGVFVMDIGASISAPRLGQVEAQDVIAPLPVFGLRGAYAIAPKWFLRGGVQLFAIEYDEYSGHLLDALVAIDYDVFSWAGVGVGINYVDLGVEVEKSNFTGSADYSYGGVMLYAKVFY